MKDVPSRLSCHPLTVIRLWAAGKLPGLRLTGERRISLRFEPAEVEAFIQRKKEERKKRSKV